MTGRRPHDAALDDDRHHPGAPVRRARPVASDERFMRPGWNRSICTHGLRSPVSSTSAASPRRIRVPSGRSSRSTPDGGHVLAELAGRDLVPLDGELVEELALEQVHLPHGSAPSTCPGSASGAARSRRRGRRRRCRGPRRGAISSRSGFENRCPSSRATATTVGDGVPALTARRTPCAASAAPSRSCACPTPAARPIRARARSATACGCSNSTVAAPASTMNTSSASTSRIAPTDISHTPIMRPPSSSSTR